MLFFFSICISTFINFCAFWNTLWKILDFYFHSRLKWLLFFKCYFSRANEILRNSSLPDYTTEGFFFTNSLSDMRKRILKMNNSIQQPVFRFTWYSPFLERCWNWCFFFSARCLQFTSQLKLCNLSQVLFSRYFGYFKILYMIAQNPNKLAWNFFFSKTIPSFWENARRLVIYQCNRLVQC